jgi:hypothetical protein
VPPQHGSGGDQPVRPQPSGQVPDQRGQHRSVGPVKVRTYASLPLGAVDASVIAIAERLKLTDVATLDRRHFTVVRPQHVNALNLLP